MQQHVCTGGNGCPIQHEVSPAPTMYEVQYTYRAASVGSRAIGPYTKEQAEAVAAWYRANAKSGGWLKSSIKIQEVTG